MPWEEWRDVGPETVGLASDISRGAHLSSRRPRIETRRAIRSRRPPWKKGVHSKAPAAPPHFYSLSLSLSLPFFFSSPAHLHHDLSLLLSLASPLFSSFFLFISLSLSSFAAFASHGLRPLSRFPVNESEFSRLHSRPPNNRERVISYSACHTRYPPIFLPANQVEFIAGKCQMLTREMADPGPPLLVHRPCSVPFQGIVII